MAPVEEDGCPWVSEAGWNPALSRNCEDVSAVVDDASSSTWRRMSQVA
jgi:hypothetical protein